MYTNWLTGTSGTNNHNQNNPQHITNNNNNLLTHNSLENRLNSNSLHAASAANSTTNLLTNPAGHILMSTPPDVVLEVGPAPSTVRFVAHSIVLGMHSGYLRSAIRLDEHILAERNTSSSTATSTAGSPDFVLFLSNVTAEQFAPLLTYMYTGYLDLNIENIFGVLLATHVLHMPRALEICRSFLTRAQTEGYLGARLAANANHQTTAAVAAAATTNLSNTNSNNNKIIRPIPSKATAMPHFGFLPTIATATTAPTTAAQQQQQQQQIIMANFKQLQRHTENLYQQQQQTQQESMENENATTNERAKSEEIDVDQESLKATSENDDKISEKETMTKPNPDNDEEDEEVFIDSDSEGDDNFVNDNESDNDEMEVIIEVKASKSKQQQKQKQKTPTTSASKTKEDIKRHQKKNASSTRKETANGGSHHRQHQHHQTKRRAQKSRAHGLQIAKAPIPASQLDVNEGSKVIIDVASCDGPVRFRRILNTAYGHKPENFTQQMPERSQQSVSYSFHQQMARTIHHQQKQQQQQEHHQRQHLQQKQNILGEESENSESSGGGGIGTSSNKHQNSKAANQLNSNEIYVCVYCKHTFKSQYCYQKHAKRHLNPLSLNPSEQRCDKAAATATAAAAAAMNANLNFNGAQFNASATGGGGGANVGVGCLPTMPPLLATKQTANDLLRREVRPLDMNVQYYPCKTCGSKFPSYYFVHKHRKLCHADEELNHQVVPSSAEKAKNAANGTSDTSQHSSQSEEINKDQQQQQQQQQQSNANDLLDSKANNNTSVSNHSNSDNADEEHQVIKHEH